MMIHWAVANTVIGRKKKAKERHLNARKYAPPTFQARGIAILKHVEEPSRFPGCKE